MAALAKEFLISVTAFFRDNEAFDLIAKEVLPDLLKKLTPGEELKMWVAACATGEEAYSIAILIAEQLTGDFEDTVVKIFATDIDGPALVYAGKGIYNAGITKTVSPERIERYFLKEGSNFRVNPGIRKMVIFAHHDMVKNPPYCNMHFISCRNLLIYMTPVLQKKIFSMLLFGLKRDGYLFLGSSESPTPIIQNLEMVSKTWKVYKNLKSKREVSFDAFSMPVFVDAKRLISPITHDISKNNSNFLDEAVNINFANEFDCLTICIDQNNNVLKSYGNTAKYLRQKNFSSNLPELLPRQLALAFGTLSKTALKTGERVVVNGIKTKYNQTTIKVSLALNPVNIKKGEPKVLMVTIYEDKSFNPGQSGAMEFDENTLNNQYTIDIEEELKEMKDKLHLAYEQLDASNENMQSFNEEMISANEEMQSTNEEMQSINEELDTINADYQLKNKELLEINDDLNNYFRSNINGQLFINNDLKLMKFSPGTVKQINLLDTDIGRPLSNISTNIKFETIIDDTKKVMKDGCVITKEIETNDGKWYQIMTMPYVKQVGNRNSGAIITFNDVTELKKTQLELDKKNESLMRINADLDHFVHAASHDLLGPLGNIEGSIELMNSKIVDPEQNKFMSVITLSLRKFRALIQDIAMIARIEGDNIDKEMVDIDELINNIEWSLENKINLAGAIIIRDLKVKKVRFSKKNLRSIVYNLISNAIKFRREEIPLIKVNTLQEGDYVILSVQDNGKGIPPDGLNKIFDMYGRLHQDIEGQGVGLYLAKKIINAANGHINVESEPGVGSKFVIFLKT